MSGAKTLALLALWLLACKAAPDPVFHVAGHVDTLLSAGVITVWLDDSIKQVVDATTGNFRFDDVPPGHYTVTVEATFNTLQGPKGKKLVGAPVDTSAGDVDSVLLSVTPIGQVNGLVVKLKDGMPLAGARVFVAGTAAVAFSQPDGSFTLDGVPLGVQVVVAQATGFLPARQARVQVSAVGGGAILLSLAEDTSGDSTLPNQLPVISALHFAPKDNHADNPRAIPAASAARPDLVHAQSIITLSVDAMDPEGQALTYLWSASNGSLSSGEGPTVDWTSGTSDAEVDVQVFDPQGGSATSRQTFTLPSRSIRSAAIYHHQIIYSETRLDDTRDIIGFDLDAGTETTVFAADGEQHAPRVVGDTLLFADQVFTFVQPVVFRMRLLGLLPNSPLNTTFGQTLSPDQGFDIDYRLYTPLTDSRVTYSSQDFALAPLGIGTFDPQSQTYAPLSAITAGPKPIYPCYVVHMGSAYGVQNGQVLKYAAGGPTLVATLPETTCGEMQADGDFLVVNVGGVFSALAVVNLKSGSVSRVGTQALSFVLHGTKLAYTDKRGGFTGVYIQDLASGAAAAVPVRGFFDRRVLEMNSELLVYGENDPAASVSPFSSQGLQVYRLP